MHVHYDDVLKLLFQVSTVYIRKYLIWPSDRWDPGGIWDTQRVTHFRRLAGPRVAYSLHCIRCACSRRIGERM